MPGGGRARRWAWSEMGVVGDGRGRRWAWPLVGVSKGRGLDVRGLGESDRK